MMTPLFKTELGQLFSGDCVKTMSLLPEGSVDAIFADPPFNIGKSYRSGVNDSLSGEEYSRWTREWLTQAERLLKPGGSIFVYNLPRWNIATATILTELGLIFRHWIAIDMPNGFPIKGRLYPSHYSLLYFTKGNPARFQPPRVMLEKCRHCGKDSKDYGGHRKALNPAGLNLKDVWVDIGKVTNRKVRSANQLPIKLMDRVIDICTNPGDLILDPFAGSGTTLVTAELKGRSWIGIELDDCSDITNRFANLQDDREKLAAAESVKNRLEAA